MGGIKLEGSKKAGAIRNNLDQNTEEGSLSSSSTPGDSHAKKNSGVCRQILLLIAGILIIFSLFVGILFAIEFLHPDSRKPPQPVSRAVNEIVIDVSEERNDLTTQQNDGLVDDIRLLKLTDIFSNVLSTVRDFFNSSNDSSLSENEKIMIDTNAIHRSNQQPPIRISMVDNIKEEELIEEINQEEESDYVSKSKIVTLINQEMGDFKHFH